jgi:hypothetical protein
MTKGNLKKPWVDAAALGWDWHGLVTQQTVLAQQARSSHYGCKATGRVAGNKEIGDQRKLHVTLVHVHARSWVGDLEEASVHPLRKLPSSVDRSMPYRRRQQSSLRLYM